MATGFNTANLANKLLDSIRGVSFSNGATWAVLHTGDPGASGTSNASAGSTTRNQVSFSAASNGTIALTGSSPVWVNSGATETISHVSVWSEQSSGSFLFSAQLTPSRSWSSGDVLGLTELSVNLSTLAA